VRQRFRRVAAVLIVASAGLFIIGVNAESDSHSEAAESEAVHHEAAGEHGAAHSEAGEAASAEDGHEDASEDDERLLGVDVESPAAVSLAVAVSLALAVGLWLRRQRWLAVAAVGVAGIFAVFDIAEVAHQVDESNTGLVVLATVIAVGHLAAAVAARRSMSDPISRDHDRGRRAGTLGI